MTIKSKNFETISILNCNDDDLIKISQKRTLSLNITEMKTIQEYYKKINREPTDIELETLAQTWSEHCKHKVFNSAIEITINGKKKKYKNLFKETIVKATKDVRKKLDNKDFCISVFSDNAGIIDFDEKNGVAFKVETHNHPSALDPYGGANTGIGGVIRDILGCGLGAKPIFNTDVFCFAYPTYSYTKLPKGILHPKRIYKGVVSGVRDYGNRMGIPTINGAINFHNNYLGNPLVYCGTAGLIPKDKVAKITKSGYNIITMGGRTGRDGIHGATFSSAELHTDSETTSSQAVQIGNPIEEKKVQDVLLKARDLNLYINVTDCGAGGFASAVGEMAEETGADIYLDKAPLKYHGLAPWEIFLSESQERMVVLVSPKKTEQLLKLCQEEDVEAVAIGKTTNSHKLSLYYKQETVGQLDMEFLHNGVPSQTRTATYITQKETDSPVKENLDYKTIFKALLSEPNSSSKEGVIRQYDHEVGGGTFLKPLQGIKNDGPGDASACTPLLNSPEKTIVTGNGINIRYGLKNPYKMALSVIDEALRQIVVAGGNPARTAILDNFCWGNPNKNEQLASLVMASQACYDAATAYNLPFISGKDSFYNEFSIQNKSIAIPPTLLISAISVTETKNLMHSFFQNSDSLIYLIGETKNELGGSAFYDYLKKEDGIVPDVNLKTNHSIFMLLHKAIKNNLVASAHDLSENGLAGAISEMAFSANIGALIELKKMIKSEDVKYDYQLLFSESNTRFLVEIEKKNQNQFEKTMGTVYCSVIGYTQNSPELEIFGLDGKQTFLEKLSTLKKAWQTDKVFK